MQSSCTVSCMGQKSGYPYPQPPPDQELVFTDVWPGQLRSASRWPNKPGRMPHTTPGLNRSLQWIEWGFRTMARRRGHLCTNLVPKRNSCTSCLSHRSHAQTSQRRPLSPDSTSRRPQGDWTSVLPHRVSFRSSAKHRTWRWDIAQTHNKKRRGDSGYRKPNHCGWKPGGGPPNPGGGANGMPGGAPGKPGGRKPGGGPGMPGGAKGMGGRCREGAPIGGIMPIPRPAGMPLPGPAGSEFFLSSSPAGGGPSTLKLTTVSPRRITRPSVLFISCTGPASVSPGLFFERTRLNSSHSASTRFICLSKASIWPTNARPSFTVTFSLQLMRPSILPPFDFGGGMVDDDGVVEDGRAVDACNNELEARMGRQTRANNHQTSSNPHPKRRGLVNILAGPLCASSRNRYCTCERRWRSNAQICRHRKRLHQRSSAVKLRQRPMGFPTSANLSH